MKYALSLLILLSVTACAPTIETRGNMISDSKVTAIQAGVSTRADVVQQWGPPTTTSSLDPNTWYFIGETTAQQGIYAAEVQKRRIVRVKFDTATDIVSEVVEIDPKLARDVNLVDRKTPTAGKEYTMFQQFVGNLGKFNTDEKKK